MISKVVKIFFVESKYKGTYKIEYQRNQVVKTYKNLNFINGDTYEEKLQDNAKVC